MLFFVSFKFAIFKFLLNLFRELYQNEYNLGEHKLQKYFEKIF